MNRPRVAIVVLNWNGLDDSLECLESLKKLNYDNSRVVLVDNGSAGDDVQVLRDRFGDYVHIIENGRNYGFAEGNNIGVRYALATYSPDYVLLLNNDTVVEPQMLAELVKAAESDASIGLAGPEIYSYDALDRKSPGDEAAGRQIIHPPPSTIVDRIEGSLIFRITVPRRMRRKQVFLMGCALLIKKTVIAGMGLLYPGYFAYYEETEYCNRCAKAGIRLVFVPTAFLWHKVGATTNKISGFSTYYGARNRLLYVARNSSALGTSLYLLSLAFLIGPVQVILRVLRNDRESLVAYCRGVCAGMRCVITMRDRERYPLEPPPQPL